MQKAKDKVKNYIVDLLMKNDIPIIGTRKTIFTSETKAHIQGSMLMELYNRKRSNSEPEATGWRIYSLI